MKKRFLVIVPVLVTSVSLVYFLHLLEGFVYGTLYNYGLVFDDKWANPYWMMLSIVNVLLVLNTVFSIVGCLYLYRKSVQVKPKMPGIVETRVQTHTTVQERSFSQFRKQKPRPQHKPEVARESYVNTGLVKCNHCGKEFAQPLRMLDFHEEPPRMINVCPFCSEVIQPSVEDERRRRLLYLDEKNDNSNT